MSDSGRVSEDIVLDSGPLDLSPVFDQIGNRIGQSQQVGVTAEANLRPQIAANLHPTPVLQNANWR